MMPSCDMPVSAHGMLYVSSMASIIATGLVRYRCTTAQLTMVVPQSQLQQIQNAGWLAEVLYVAIFMNVSVSLS
jgi:hypothetical protein